MAALGFGGVAVLAAVEATTLLVRDYLAWCQVRLPRSGYRSCTLPPRLPPGVLKAHGGRISCFNRALSTCARAAKLGESSAVFAARFNSVLRKLGPAECPRSAKKIVLIAHGFHIFNGSSKPWWGVVQEKVTSQNIVLLHVPGSSDGSRCPQRRAGAAAGGGCRGPSRERGALEGVGGHAELLEG